MAMTKRQVEEYGSMSFEELCDLIDQYKENEEDLIRQIEDLKSTHEKEIEELQNEIKQLSNN